MRHPIVALAISSASLLACSHSDVDPVGTPETENQVASEEATDGATNTPTETTAARSDGTPATTVANAAASGTVNTVECVRITDFDTTMLNWAHQAGMPVRILLTKADKLKRGPAMSTLLQVRKALQPYGGLVNAQLFSAPRGDGLDDLREQLDVWLTARFEEDEELDDLD